MPKLELTADRLQRYRDYEVMDDFPTLGGATGPYADDATMPEDWPMHVPGFKRELAARRSRLYHNAQMELRNARASLAAGLAPYFSRGWILRQVLRFTEDEARAIEAQVA